MNIALKQRIDGFYIVLNSLLNGISTKNLYLNHLYIFTPIIIYVMFLVSCSSQKHGNEPSVKDNIIISSLDTYIHSNYGNIDTIQLKKKFSKIEVVFYYNDSLVLKEDTIIRIYKDTFFITVAIVGYGYCYNYYYYNGKIFIKEYRYPNGRISKRFYVRKGYYYRDGSIPMSHDFF